MKLMSTSIIKSQDDRRLRKLYLDQNWHYPLEC